MTYYTDELDKVILDNFELVKIKVSTLFGETEKKTRTIPKKYIMALRNDLLIDEVGE